MTGTLAPSRRSAPVRLARTSRGALLVVWGAWALMLASALWFLGRYGSNVPSWDGWDMVPTLTGRQPVTLDWLWSQHNEHRVPLPRLLLLGLHGVTGVDFRTPMVFNLLAVAALAAAAIRVVARQCGGTHHSDALIPVILLHWGHATNLLWGWQVQFFASALLAGVVLLLIAQTGPGPRIPAATAAGLLLVLLPLCGANGVALVPALAIWLLYLARERGRAPAEPAARREAGVVGALAVTALGLVAVYFVGYEPVPWHPGPTSLIGIPFTSLKFLTVGLGPAFGPAWPASGLLTLVGSLLSASLLVHVWRDQRAERYRSAGLLLFLAAMASLALGLGLGRDGFEPRYVTLASPFWLCIFLVWRLYGPAPWGAALPTGLLAVSLVALWPNLQWGVRYGADLRGMLGAFERDMAAGVPPHELIGRYGEYLHPHSDVITEYMPMLREAGVGQFRHLRDDPEFREVPVALTPREAHHVTWVGNTAHTTHADAHLVFSLPETTRACGIRMAYSHASAAPHLPMVTLLWRSGAEEGFEPERSKKYSPTGDRAVWVRGTWTRLDEPATTLTSWGCRPVRDLRIDLMSDVPDTFVIRALTLMVPVEPRS